jgi:hypothetical protein
MHAWLKGEKKMEERLSQTGSGFRTGHAAGNISL